jgi:predicted acyltransferase
MTLPQRLKSLDVFRGIAIASMILVNNPGSWDYIYPPLDHAEWNGCTPTDLIFPFFLFIVGAAMPFSLSKYTKENRPTREVYWRIGRRALILFGLGLFLALFSLTLDFLLNGMPASKFAAIRIMGVLQRISLAYLISAIAVLNLQRRALWILAAILLIGYWLAMQFIPVPGYGAGNLTPEGNLVGYIDRLILGQQHLLGGKGFDPEGLLSTLPAVVTVLAGYFTGEWLKSQPRQSRTSISLAIFGSSCVLVGHLWGLLFPINKQLWTSSYVIFTAGFALLLLAACYELVEVRGFGRLAFPLEVMGLNAIFAFVGSGLVARILIKTHIGNGSNAPTTYTWIYQHLFKPWAGALNGSLLFAIATVCFWWVMLYLMYRRNWYFKI